MVDYRLKAAWTNAVLWRRTGEKAWLDLLKVMALTETGVVAKFAERTVHAA